MSDMPMAASCLPETTSNMQQLWVGGWVASGWRMSPSFHSFLPATTKESCQIPDSAWSGKKNQIESKEKNMKNGFRAIHDFFFLQWRNYTQFQKEFVYMRIQRICANLWELLQYCNSKENKFHHV
jgi:hypothetical protein